MVLQEGREIPLWGRFYPRTSVVIRFLAKEYLTQTDDSGNWLLTLDPAAPGGPYLLAISGPEKGESLSFNEVFIGEVWLCSGQSNMELSMGRLRDDYSEEFEQTSFPCVSQYIVPYTWDFSGPRADIPEARWVRASAESLAGFSGTGWFFAKYLRQSRPVPIGLIVAAVGGAPIESLMSRESLALFPRKIAQGFRYADPGLLKDSIDSSLSKARRWDDAVDREDIGLALRWSSPDVDDSSWDSIDLPGWFGEAEGLAGFCGAMWLRKSFHVPADMEGKDLKLWMGTIVDADSAFVNGVQVGGTAYRYPPRKYLIPAGVLKAGENRIALRVICTNGQGGVTPGKPFHIFPASRSPSSGAIGLRGAWKFRIGARIDPRPEEFRPQWQPMGLFNGMIAPLLRLPFRGVLWYQGEANADDPVSYAELFSSLIADWRRRAGRDDLPFLFVQLPLFGEPQANAESSAWARLRQAQASALRLPSTGMAAALDLGEWNDLHPLNKKEVGRRLALAADSIVYNKGNTSPGPLVKSVRRQGDSIRISFSNVGNGLSAIGRGVGEDDGEGVFVGVATDAGDMARRRATIALPDRLLVDIAGIDNPRSILYAWADNPADRQLFNSDSLPALPFQVQIPRPSMLSHLVRGHSIRAGGKK